MTALCCFNRYNTIIHKLLKPFPLFDDALHILFSHAIGKLIFELWTRFLSSPFCYITNHLMSNFCQKNKSVLQRLISSAASSFSQLPQNHEEEEKTLSNFEVICNFIFTLISDVTLDDTLKMAYKQNNPLFPFFELLILEIIILLYLTARQ